MSELNENEELIETIEEEIDDATVMTVPIDDTLSISGEAADAKAVGDALALKMDKSANEITVNGKGANAQGQIQIYGTDIPVSSATGAQDIGTIIQTMSEAVGDMEDVIEELEGGTVKTVNSQAPDAGGNVQIDKVKFAENLQSDSTQNSTGEYAIRTTGGEASLSDGDGWVIKIRGKRIHTGYTAKSVEMTVTQAEGSDITATIDEDAFLEAVDTTSGTKTLFYSSGWNETPATYGITVTGTPVNGDSISVEYQKEIRGTITQSNPATFRSTGWNLYDHEKGYAVVTRYSEVYGFGIAGTYTALKYSETLTGTKETITPVAGFFTVPGDGYLWVTGGNDTDTEIWMTWRDWDEEANGGVFEAYTDSEIDLSGIMEEHFPNGLCQCGSYRDEIDLNLGAATQNVGRMAYNSTNLAAAEAMGTAYEYDENYIYYGMSAPVVNAVTITGDFAAYDHGMEMFEEEDTDIFGTVGVYAETLYGVNLKNRLERDVLTISQQTLTSTQKAQARENSGSAGFLSFGIGTKTIQENLTSYWVSNVPNDGKTYTIALTALYGTCYGTISRYSNNYGAAVLVRYDGKLYEAYLNNGTVTVRNTKGSELSTPTTFDTNIRSVSSVKKGDIVAQTMITVKSGLASNWYNGLATGLPSSFCPSGSVFGSMRINSSSDSGKAAYGILDTNGLFQMYIGSSFSSDIVFSFTYVCKG